MLDKYKGLTPGNQGLFIFMVILTSLLYAGAIMLGITAFPSGTDPITGMPREQSNKKIVVAVLLLVLAAVSTWYTYSIYNDTKREKKCNTAMWTTMNIFAPTNFTETQSNVASICDAQIHAQYSDSDSYAFILRKYSDSDFGYMTIPDKGYSVRSGTTSDTFVIYYKKDAALKITGTPATPPACPAGQSGSPCAPIVCPAGTTLVGNTCTSPCPTGTSGSPCAPIVCPAGTTLVGNNCSPTGGGSGSPVGCPPGNYTYCSGSNVSKLYTQNGCSPSAALQSKLGLSMSKVINCSDAANATECAAITSFPTVVCDNNSRIVGFCP
jgi:hypothetical protein